MRLSLAMKSEQIKIIPEMLSGDEHQGLRTSIYSIFLEYEQRRANMIVVFSAEKDVTL